MTDSVKMAIEALRPFADAAGHIHPAHPDEATSLDGFPMSDFRRAAETMAALEQAGDPVAVTELDERNECMVCTGCGTTKTIAFIKASSPTAFTCCPERKMIPVRDAIKPMEAGWIVSNGNGDRWRTWKRGWSEWTAMRDHATRYARREDAEAVHGEDEDAWRVEPYAPLPTLQRLGQEFDAGEGVAGEGWVYWNQDSGEEYALNHPVESGECVEAEHVRRSTGMEDHFNAEFQRLTKELAAPSHHPTAEPVGLREAQYLIKSIAEVVEKDGGCWSACSGCQESVDGYVSSRDYPYSQIFKCQPGCGCRECGGIGVVWQDGNFLASYGDALAINQTERVYEPYPGAFDDLIGPEGATTPAEHDGENVLAKLEAIRDVVAAAYYACEDSEDDGGDNIHVMRSSWEQLSASLDAIDAIMPDEVQPALPAVLVTLVMEAFATPSQPDPQSRGQAFDGEGEGWRPIESAPKDGTEIILFGPYPENSQGIPTDRVTAGFWTEPEPPVIGDCGGECRCPEYGEPEDPHWCSMHGGSDEGWMSTDGGFTREWPPTHWMPLPDFPALSSAKRGEEG